MRKSEAAIRDTAKAMREYDAAIGRELSAEAVAVGSFGVAVGCAVSSIWHPSVVIGVIIASTISMVAIIVKQKAKKAIDAAWAKASECVKHTPQ